MAAETGGIASLKAAGYIVGLVGALVSGVLAIVRVGRVAERIEASMSNTNLVRAEVATVRDQIRDLEEAQRLREQEAQHFRERLAAALSASAACQKRREEIEVRIFGALEETRESLARIEGRLGATNGARHG